jgi:transposase
MVYLFEKHVTTKYGKYTYICLGEAARVNGRSVRTWELKIGRKDTLGKDIEHLKRRLSSKPPQAEEFEFGLIVALHAICREIDLAGAINAHVDKREQGFSAGDYITIAAINRAVSLNSKSQVKDWFAKTTLSLQYPGIHEALTAQNIWNQMGYLDQDTIRKIEQLLAKTVFSTFNLDPDCFLFDPTNFYTFIREHDKNTIAQRGHNKKNRGNLRQVNLSMLVTRGAPPVPVMHETYEGNVPDVSHFKDVLATMNARLAAIGINAAKITLVFDKGNNSPDAFKKLDADDIHFVTSLKPSTCHELAEIPLSTFELLWTKPNGHKVLGYRTTMTKYMGKIASVVVTFDEDTFKLQDHALDKRVKKATTKLQAFIASQLNTKPQWKDATAVTKKITRDFLKPKELRAIIVPAITKRDGDAGLDVTWQIDDAALETRRDKLGKSYIMTNQNTWSTADIVRTYRAQHKIEDQFKALNDRTSVSVMPMYHWTDQKIRAHVFISVLALLLTAILQHKILAGGIKASKKACLDALRDMKEIHLHYDDGNPPDVVSTRMSPLQKAIFKVLNLQHHSVSRR